MLIVNKADKDKFWTFKLKCDFGSNEPLPTILRRFTTRSGDCNKDLHKILDHSGLVGNKEPMHDLLQTLLLASIDGNNIPGFERPATIPEARTTTFLEIIIRGFNVNTDGLTDALFECFMDGLMGVYKSDLGLEKKYQEMQEQIDILIEKLNKNSGESARPKYFSPVEVEP